MSFNLSSTETSYLSLNQKTRTLQTRLAIVASLYSQRSANFWRRSFLPDSELMESLPKYTPARRLPPRVIQLPAHCISFPKNDRSLAWVEKEGIRSTIRCKKSLRHIVACWSFLQTTTSRNYTGQAFDFLRQWNGMESPLKQSTSINQGVEQGGVLSPFLYNLYVNDLLVELENSG